MKVTIEMTEDQLKLLRAILIVRGMDVTLGAEYQFICTSTANQIDKQVYPLPHFPTRKDKA